VVAPVSHPNILQLVASHSSVRKDGRGRWIDMIDFSGKSMANPSLMGEI